MTQTKTTKTHLLLSSLLLMAMAITSGCAAMAAQQKAVDTARAATYQVSPGDAYTETYALLSSSYAIAKESERRGFIETDWKEDADYEGIPTRTKVTAEVLGEGQIRIVMRATVERKVAGSWAAEPDDASSIEDELYVTLHNRMKSRPPQG